jgi:GNAT superfamily N-acetyltransferase
MERRTKEFFTDWGEAKKRAKELSNEQGLKYRVLSHDKDGKTEYIVQLTESIVDKILKEGEEINYNEFLDKVKILQGEYEQKGVDTNISLRQHQSIHIEKIFVKNRNEGYGSAFLEALTDLCDDYGIICTLSETSEYGSNIERLRKFYRRFGFRSNKGSKADHRFWVGMIRMPRTVVSEDVRTLNMYRDKTPINDNEKIRVYHGFGGYAKSSALKSIRYGLSGQERADRAYSYEWVNNPKGLFVTIDFKVAERQFAGSGVIIEFDTMVSNLEAPVWKGQDSFFVPGQYTDGFKDDEERKAEQLRKRQQYKDKDPEGNDKYGMNQRISKSDRPELAQSLFNGGEQQALFIGNLDPNNIKYVWFHEGRFFRNNTRGEWTRMTRIEFLKKMKDELSQKNDTLQKGADKLFRPNEDFTIDKLTTILNSKGYDVQDFLKYYGRDSQYLNTYFYPKQIQQLTKYLDDNKIE